MVIEFTEADTHKFNKEVRKIIAFGRVMGWQARWGTVAKRMAILRAPDGAEINIPTSNINANRTRSWLKKLLRHSDPKMVLKIIGGDFDMVKEPDIAELVVRYGAELLDIVRQGRDEEEAEMAQTMMAAMEEAEKEAALKQARTDKRRGVHVVGVEVIEPDTVSEGEEEVEEQPERKIVSERPWLARSGGTAGSTGKVYESQGVMVITYDDGTEAFKCRFCDFTHPTNPRSVKMHAANKKAHDPSHQDIAAKVLLTTDDYQPTDIKKPHRTAIARLTNDLVAALDGVEAWQALEAHELASVLAHRVVDARPEHHTSAEPLTAAQVLARITSLVDNGQIASLHHQIGEMRDALAEQTARAEKAVGNLTALREMLNSEAE